MPHVNKHTKNNVFVSTETERIINLCHISNKGNKSAFRFLSLLQSAVSPETTQEGPLDVRAATYVLLMCYLKVIVAWDNLMDDVL